LKVLKDYLPGMLLRLKKRRLHFTPRRRDFAMAQIKAAIFFLHPRFRLYLMYKPIVQQAGAGMLKD